MALRRAVQSPVVEGREGVPLVVVVTPQQPPLDFEGQPSYPEGLGEVAPPPADLLHREEEQEIPHPAHRLLYLILEVVGVLVVVVVVEDLWVQLEALRAEEEHLVMGHME